MSVRIVLAIQGPQDVEPDTSYFRQVYRSHTNFAFTTVQQKMEGTIAAGGTSKFTLSRQGDLVSGIYLRSNQQSNRDMRTKIDYVRLFVGGQEIIKMTQRNLHTYQSLMSNTYCKGRNADHGQLTGIASLHFWFCENWGAALPLCALSYHDVVVEVKWLETPNAGFTFEAWAKMIWVDNSERMYFARAPKLSYVMNQWQNSDPIGREVDDPGPPITYKGTRSRMDLNFKHPIRMLVVDVDDPADTQNKSNLVRLLVDGVEIHKLTIRQMEYSMYYHCPFGRLDEAAERYPIIPFALDLSTDQPSGTLNFSRLSNVELVSDLPFVGSSVSAVVSAVNTNVFHIKEGMGGLEFM